MKLKYTIDNAAAKKLLASYPPAIQQAMVSAVNKTAAKARTAVGRQIRQSHGLPMSAISQRVRSTGRRRLDVQKATRSNPTAFLIASGRALALMLFKAKQTAAGLVHRAPFAVAAGAQIAGQTVRSGFLAVGRSKTKMPFIRTPGATRRARKSPKRLQPDLPISAVYGPSVAELYELVGGDQIVQRVAQTEYPIILERELAFRLK